ncbi:MAG TPA: GIY-YIG nuclease family protein [Anaerolineales bacterium]|nr:GIY-YIG nuclease family protein [Anaerolineales bacterium]
MSQYVYILLCGDDSYYTGSTGDLSRRLYEHQNGRLPGAYTFRRRPVELMWYTEVPTVIEALGYEHQIKGWSRAKKEALIRGDVEGIHAIVRAERRRREKQ